MDFYFLIDVYADRHLIDAYIISFRLYDKSCVRVAEYEGREYVVEVLDWEAFKKSAKEVVLYEYGDEIARFSDIEVALSEAYRMSCIEASKRMPKVIEPAIGIGNPPPEVVEKVFPLNYKLTPFPENLDSFLEELVKNLEIESFEWEKADDDEIPF